MYRISASSSKGSGRFAEKMAITVAEVMQVPHSDGVRIGQDCVLFI